MSYTPVIPASVKGVTRPARPVSLHGTVVQNTVALRWAQKSTPSRPVVGNTIAVDGSVVTSTTAPITALTVRGLSVGLHSITVSTYNAAGQSAPARTHQRVLPFVAPGIIPGRPTVASAVLSGADATLSWTNGANAQQIVVSRNGHPFYASTFPGAVPTSLLVPKVSPGLQVFTIQGLNYNGLGAAATVNVTGTTPTPVAPLSGRIVALGDGGEACIMTSDDGGTTWVQQGTPFDGGFVHPRGMALGQDGAGHSLLLVTGTQIPESIGGDWTGGNDADEPNEILSPWKLMWSYDAVIWYGPLTPDPAGIAVPTTNPCWSPEAGCWAIGGIAQMQTDSVPIPQTVIFTSLDGNAWAVTPVAGGMIPNKIAWGPTQGQWIMVGERGINSPIAPTLLVSTIGIPTTGWTEQVNSLKRSVLVDSANDIAFGGRACVVMSNPGSIFSYDANPAWTRAYDGAAGSVWAILGDSGYANSLDWLNNHVGILPSVFAICGDNHNGSGPNAGAAILTSPDGQTWTELPVTAAGALDFQGMSGAICNSTNYFFGSGEASVIQMSADLTTFTSPVTPWDNGGAVSQLLLVP